MKGFKKFYIKLAAVLFLFLVFMGAFQIWLMFHTTRQFVQEVDQRLNRNLAQDMARELLPALQDSLDLQEAGHRIHYMMVMNPSVEIYLLDSTGHILAFFAEPGKTVDLNRVPLEPVHQFLEGQREYPVLGVDPRHPGSRKPFSATRLRFAGQEGYLYIILGGQQYQSAAKMVLNSYIFKTSIWFVVLFVGLSTVVGLVVFAMLTRRLRQVTEAVTAFEEGDHQCRVHISGEDEIAQLGNAFNRMADRIVDAFNQLKQQDEQRRQLVANVSHDLRSPLASIQGYLETILIKWDSLTPQEQRQYIKISWNNTRMLHQLIEELFELSRLDAQHIQPRFEPLNVAELVQDVVLKFQPQAEQKQVQIHTRWPERLPPVPVDIALLERAFSNLLDNAIRYSPTNGKVEISITHLEACLRFHIRDHGPGIPPQDLPHIFERFYRVDKSRTLGGGAGLGLAIASRIVALHHSQLQVKSEVGKGTIFWFDLACDASKMTSAVTNNPQSEEIQ